MKKPSTTEARTRPKGVMKTPGRPRMADIAREANVNRITVSRALSHPELVAEDTLKRIHAAIEKYGYIPNQIARVMKSEHSRFVTLVTPPQMSGVYGAILEDLSLRLHKSGLIVNLFPVHDIEGHQETVLRELVGWRPAAIVLFGAEVTPESMQLLRKAQVPLVELLSYEDGDPSGCVGYDQREAAHMLTEHLVSRHYRKICYVHSARSPSRMHMLRLGGFSDAIKAGGGILHSLPAGAGRETEPEGVPGIADDALTGSELRCRPNFQAGFSLMSEVSKWPVIPDAILCASDMVAIGALQYCVSHGLRLRDDIALCAFDGIELTSVIEPQLTCLDFPYKRVITEGAKLIVESVRDRSKEGRRIRIPVEVLHRDST
jgi:LacI family gluconate utilization system Gnt-I transcriptional repressor